MSQKLVSHSADLSRLRADGYDVSIGNSGHLLVKDVPHVTSDRKVSRGILVSELDVAGDTTTTPKNHVAFFVGGHPCNLDGSPLPGVSMNSNAPLPDELNPNHQLSRKPTTGSYRDYYEKMTTYIAIITSPAQAIDATVTAKTYPVVVPDDGESVFNYLDTAATKAGIVEANRRLEHGKVAIVGLGGAGSYLLDLVAKTPVPEIHLFDHDYFLNHNAFRAPGAPSIETLAKKPQKVHYFAELYSKMRKGIVAHDCWIDESTVGQLQGMSFVFLCIDKGGPKKLIVERLEEWGIPFIDMGMGIQLSDENALGGTVTITASTPKKRDHLRNRVAFGDGEAENEYSRNIQIAELSALNAALAVIKWKKLCGYYHDFASDHWCAYMIGSNQLISEDKHAG